MGSGSSLFQEDTPDEPDITKSRNDAVVGNKAGAHGLRNATKFPQKAQPKVSVPISITTPDGVAVATISAQPTVDTVYHICARISEAAQIPVQRQQLLFAGRELQRDGRTLAEHGVVGESTLQLNTLRKAGPLDALFAEADAPVFRVMGETAPGSTGTMMYYHGALGSDGRLYLTPKNATRAARFDPATGSWETFGDTFPEGGDKWTSLAVSSFDNCMYAVPVSCDEVSRVLQIDPSKGTARQVGDSVLDLAAGVTSWAWHGTVAAGDGCVYGMPFSATSVLRFNPRTQELSAFGELEDAASKYVSGILGPAGRFIFCVPYDAARVLCVDTKTQTCELIGDDFNDEQKWKGGGIGGDGAIYCIPFFNDHVLRIDPEAKTTSLFGPALHGGTNIESWSCGAVGADGCIYGTPRMSDRVLRVDPVAGTVSTVGELVPPELRGRLRSAVLGADGAILCLPSDLPCPILRLAIPNPTRHTPLLTTLLQPAQHQILREGLSDSQCHGPALAAALHWEATRAGGDKALVNGLLDAAGPVLPACVLSEEEGGPRIATLLLRVLASTVPTTKVVVVSDRVPGEGTEDMYSSGAFGADGRLYLTPRNVTHAARFDPATGSWETFGDTFPEGSDKWGSLALSSFDNCMYAVPGRCEEVSRVLQIDPSKGTARQVGDSVLDHVAGVTAFAWCTTVAAGDGCVYGMPFSATSVLRFDPRTQELSAFGELEDTEGKYLSGILGPAGRFIFCIPINAARVLCVDTKTQTCELIGDKFDGTFKWWGGGIGGDGAIYCIPWVYNRVLRIDPEAKTTSLFGPALHNASLLWAGGCAGADGCVYGRPHNSDHLLCIDPFVGTVSTLDVTIPVEVKQKFADLVLGPSGSSMWLVPSHLPCHMIKIIPPPKCSPLMETVRVLVTNPRTFLRCFHLDSLSFVSMLLHYCHLDQRSEFPSATKAQPHVNRLSITQNLQQHRPEILSALRTIRAWPLPLVRERGVEFVMHFALSSAIRLAPAPDLWKPVPSSVESWSWPPPPIVPLRAACKIALEGGAEALEAAWPALSQAIAGLLLTMVNAVRADLPRCTSLLREVFDQERNRSMDTYRKQLRRARRDPTYPEFKALTSGLLSDLATCGRVKHRVQTISSFPELRAAANDLQPRFNAFVRMLSNHCADSMMLQAPLKGCGRAVEKIVLRPGVPAKMKEEGAAVMDARHLVDILRGSLKCPDFTEITFALELLLQLDVRMGEPKKAQAAGIDLDKFQILLISIKDRFTTPTSGGWADCLVNFRFAHGDDTHHVMELQLQHEQMLVVRKAGKAHNQYNSFRSAFELLETVGEAPTDCFKETDADQPPLERIQKLFQRQQNQLAESQRQLRECKEENQSLRSQLTELSDKFDKLITRVDSLGK